MKVFHKRSRQHHDKQAWNSSSYKTLRQLNKLCSKAAFIHMSEEMKLMYLKTDIFEDDAILIAVFAKSVPKSVVAIKYLQARNIQ